MFLRDTANKFSTYTLTDKYAFHP